MLSVYDKMTSFVTSFFRNNEQQAWN